MWVLNQPLELLWYADNDECVLYAVEAGETLLLRQEAYLFIHAMQTHPDGLLNIDDILISQAMSRDEAEAILNGLMPVLSKKSLVRQVRS